MKKIIRFFDMTVAIPMKDGKTVKEIKDNLIEAVETVGSRFICYKTEIEEEKDEDEDE